MNIKQIISESIEVKQRLIDSSIDKINTCGITISDALKSGRKIMFCGNGGSAADSQHLAAELVIRLRSHINRAAIPAMALTVDPSIITAGSNDLGFENVFARQIEAFGKKGDILVGISTSGNSLNVLKAIKKANDLQMITIGLLGNKGGNILDLCSNAIVVPSDITARVQEAHILIGHIWCEMIEENLFPNLF